MESPRGRSGLVRPVRLDPTGTRGPTRGTARGKAWRRTSHGFYVPSSVEVARPEQRILEAAVLLPSAGAVTGWAALCWLGARWFDGGTADGGQVDVPLLISTHDIRPQRGILLCGEGCGPSRIVVIDGVPITDPSWTVAYMMRRAPSVRAAVIAFDMAAYSDLVSIEEVAAVIDAQHSWTGVPQARAALGLVTENAWSPKEVHLRLDAELVGGLPRMRPNVPLFDAHGRHIGTPDLLDAELGIAVEYDGAHHVQAPRRLSDITREELFRRHGLEVVRSVAGDSTDAFLSRLHAARRRAAARGGSRGWTLEPPSWWTPTLSVAQRRALSLDQQDRFLRYRAA